MKTIQPPLGKLGQPAEVIETPRLILRKPDIRDVADMFHGYAGDPVVLRFMGWRPHSHIRKTRQMVLRYLASWHTGRKYSWAITLHEENMVRGLISFKLDKGTAEIGYLLERALWGQGLMSEALHAILEQAFNLRATQRIIAICHVDNLASARVLSKNGLLRAVCLRNWKVFPNFSPYPEDCYCYIMDRRRWREWNCACPTHERKRGESVRQKTAGSEIDRAGLIPGSIH